MAFDIPEQPQNPGPFAEQHGYNDIKVKTYDYDGQCKAINPAKNRDPSSFEKFTNNENTKKAGNFVLGQLKNFILRQCS
ncbi:uncharacterized protein CYBJADRAFT_167741 [Cyberlindnera jadinii NRRL Y-1542]|uniref:Uncharacterized protein n=1 Tax=Cyberlindnera jadinii (strain ATCC 18201 / CBS 1600 / BCRC 20928 / JCM 3617 / NBRC 0987 / NRRL Y-1542) TaxID=983966 RepID=A0A1E4S2Q3_CYBJN|nr:hypothetical protein CYBJADRAFT_167741 [Cyberlindnera jadinii NRRL Y-1542]ODV73733.1 hypothetical protein CYBJADRAFT_167741 [Cyberlindnera jadinii NRRL Y-1542]